jgi:hypothetical protein
MSHSIKALLCTVILAILTPSGIVHAASVRFIPLNDEIAALRIGVKDTKGITTVKDLDSRKRSTAYNCKIGKTPLLLVAMDRKAADGNSETVEIAISPDFKSPLVLILPDPEHPSGLRAIAIEDNITVFPWGSLQFLNTTVSPLMIRYDADLISLPEGDKIVEIKPGGDARRVGVQVSTDTEQTVILYSAAWEYDPHLRELVFVVPGSDPQSKALELKRHNREKSG